MNEVRSGCAVRAAIQDEVASKKKKTIERATRYHDFSCGHRVHGHESKCALLHGHNYRVHFTIEAQALDEVGRVLDFSVMKGSLCDWLEKNWDHRTLIWEQDDLMLSLTSDTSSPPLLTRLMQQAWTMLTSSIVWVPFNPTAERIAKHLLEVVGPEVLSGYSARLVHVRVDETRKCSASSEFAA